MADSLAARMRAAADRVRWLESCPDDAVLVEWNALLLEGAAQLEQAERREQAIRDDIKRIYDGFELESLNGVVCSILDTGLDTPPHRTWCARCQRRYKRLIALAAPDVRETGEPT